MQYKRILLKLSGESLMGQKEYGIDQDMVAQYAEDIKAVAQSGVEVAIVIGGGNIYRGLEAEKGGMDRVQADYMGMLATVINSMALQDALENTGMKTRLLSAINMEQICEPFIRRRAIRHLEKGRIRSEEHTSELQSLMRISYAVFCLKKKQRQNNTY